MLRQISSDTAVDLSKVEAIESSMDGTLIYIEGNSFKSNISMEMLIDMINSEKKEDNVIQTHSTSEFAG